MYFARSALCYTSWNTSEGSKVMHLLWELRYFNIEIIELEITTLRWDIVTLNRGLFKILTWTTDIPVEENQSHLQLQLVIKHRCSILALRYKNAHHFDNY